MFRYFRWSIGRVADPFTLRLIARHATRDAATSLLDLPDRPATYDDVGRLCQWNDVFPARFLRRSRYERVLMLAIAGRPVTIGGHDYTPTAMRGWSAVVLRRNSDAHQRVMSVDALVRYLERWG